MDAQITDSDWHFIKKVLFRFLFVYLLMFMPAFFYVMPLGAHIMEYDRLFWNLFVPWLGKHVLDMGSDIPVWPVIKDDTVYNYVLVFCMLILSAVLTLLWTVIDRTRRNYDTLCYWFTVSVRYYLACAMLKYGFAKVFKVQFPFPSLTKLTEPFGDSSPMGLLWNVMGYSAEYTIFTGLGEVVAGLLLFFQHTVILGALTTFSIMSNVVVMNFSYDVSVKLISSHLLLMAIFLLVRDTRRIINFFILNRSVEAAGLTDHRSNVLAGRGRFALKGLFIGVALFTYIQASAKNRIEHGDDSPRPPLYGIYDVDVFVQNGDTLSPLLAEESRWRKMIVDKPGQVTIKRMNDQSDHYAFQPDLSNRTITMFSFADSTRISRFEYEQPAPNAMVFKGILQGDSVYIGMKRYDLNNFLLLNRGFHWINPVPFAR